MEVTMSLTQPSRRTVLQLLASGAALPLFGALPVLAFAGGPATITIIRHAEKPVGKGPPYGLAVDGTQTTHGLTTRGWARAGALADLFAASDGPLRAGLFRPTTLFASQPNALDQSLRPNETITPLSQKMNLPIVRTFGVGDEAQLAKAVLARDGNVLIAWQHEKILQIAHDLGFGNLGLPAKWPGDRFDIVFVFTRHASEWKFKQVPELLLAGDSSAIIS
jgi:hypothetical protein